VSRRILRRVTLIESDSARDYLERLLGDPEELSALYHDLLIGVTRFFRDPEAFDVIENKVIPEILEAVPESEEICVWVAGCATGEEAYSLAMLLFEALSARDREMNFKILATDVHRDSLDRGSAGFYDEEQLEHVSQRRRERFFARGPQGFQVSQDLRQRIVFAPHNVTRDAPFTRMHLITCRNMLIYLQPDAQETVISLFHFGLNTGGVLFLGSSECTGPHGHEFDPISQKWKIYRKRRDVRLLDPLSLPVARQAIGASSQLLAPLRGSADPQLLAIYDRLLDRYMPPGFLVDEKRELVDSFGGAERYLQVSRRRPSSNLLDLLRGDLRTVVAGAVRRVLGSEAIVRYTGVPLGGGDGRASRGSLAAEAIVNPRSGVKHVLVILEEETPREREQPIAEPSANLTGSEASEERLSVLESDLAYTRETLQSAVEEQQTSNEELQATNEALVASNEELQSTNEELHSVNEELYTVNGEYQKKILELRELNNDMEHLLEGSDVGTLFLDEKLQIRKLTPRISSVFHLRPADVGRKISDFSHALDRPQLFDEITQVLNEGGVIEDEVHDCHGTTYFLRILPYLPPAELSDPADNPLLERLDIHGVMLSLTDISALDHARARIHQLSAIVESSDDAIISKDLVGVITTWNRGAERLYGYRAEEVVGESMKVLAPRGGEAEIDRFLAAIREGERIEHVETVRRSKDGKLLDISVTISPIRDRSGTIVGASEIARDISALKIARRELEEREAHIRLLLESTAEAIYGLDLDGVCTFCNPAAVRMLGYDSADNLIGEKMHEVVHYSRADGSTYPESDCSMHTAFLAGRGTHADDEVLYRADGSSFPAEFWSYPIIHGGQIEGAVVTFLDITERQQANQEIHLAARRREQFLAMLSHELRNPLGAVLNATKVMAAEDSDEARARARGVIERQSGHMARLLDDLLDVSRITRGGIELRKEDVDLREAIRLAVEAVGPHVQRHAIELELSLGDEPLPVRGDSARLQQIIGNLLTNAVKYSREGGTVELTAGREGEEVVVVIKDSGFGISPELLPQIFELFVQTEQGLDRSEGGLGVGLALVRQLVELHGGRVTGHSEGENRGSEFRVVLPVQHQGVQTSSKRRTGNGAGPRRVVVVEDQEDAREMLTMLLQARGYIVYQARNGAEAIETIERVHPDVALVDLGLPILDGFEVARQLRANEVLDDVILVALTGYGTNDDVRAALEAGFSAHLTKPADPLAIDEIIRGG
jgi:two-component system CheB/CheR fusion protein